MKIELTKELALSNGITHSGAFHSDDIVATALLAIAANKEKFLVFRTPFVDENMRETGIPIYDIGGGELDHHFQPVPVRGDGTPYSSVGLIWKMFGEEILRNSFADEEINEILENKDVFEKNFVIPVDLDDNGKSEKPHFLTEVVASFSTLGDVNAAFVEAANTILVILRALIKKLGEKIISEKVYEEALAETKNGILILSRFVPFKEYILTKEKDNEKVDYIIYPSLRSGYVVEAAPILGEPFKQKKPFCEEWRGKSREELSKVHPQLEFVHASGFMAAVTSIEAAIEVINLNKEATEK